MNKDITVPQVTSIALIGMRGCGKTVVGQALAGLLDLRHVDTDEMVVSQCGHSIADIFSQQGESAFRKMEAVSVANACQRGPAIISVGGGAVLLAENVARLSEVATIVWLTAPADILFERINRDSKTPDSRPALTTSTLREEIEKLINERSSLYEGAAKFVIDASSDEPTAIARIIVRQLGLDPNS